MPFNIGATSAVKDDLRAGFISAEMSDDLSIVPGIGQGKANKAALEHAGIFTPYQLLGQFLLLKAPGMVRAPARGGARACTRVRTSEQCANAHASALALALAHCSSLPLPHFSRQRRRAQNSQQHLDAVYEWLSGIGIKGQQSLICLCLAEKAKSMMSNIFNAAELDPSNKE